MHNKKRTFIQYEIKRIRIFYLFTVLFYMKMKMDVESCSKYSFEWLKILTLVEKIFMRKWRLTVVVEVINPW